MLAAVVTGGFHPVSSYLWSVDGKRLMEETFPVMYATMRGEYVCEVITTTSGDIQVAHKLNFTVGGIYSYFANLATINMCFVIQGCDEEWLVDVPPPVGSPKARLTLNDMITSSTETGESRAPMEVGIKEEQVIQMMHVSD